MSEVDAEVDTSIDNSAPPVPLNERPADGPGSGRGELRKQLEGAVDQARKAEEAQNKSRDKSGRYVSRARQEQETTEQEPQEQEASESDAGAASEAGTEEPGQAAPAGWAQDAKAEWGNLPPAVQAAVAKRETDMAKGVEELKKSYADIDTILNPRKELIRRHGHTPAQAVNQLFAWFDALAANPEIAFPALAQSFRFDLRKIPGLTPQQQAQVAQQPPQQQAPSGQPVTEQEMPAYVKSLQDKITQLEQGFTSQLGQLQNNFGYAQQAKTQEILDNWSKDKPHFEEVRRVMGNLIASGTVPPLANGAADLDKAYDMALYAVPEVRQKILEEKAAAEAAARKAEADRKKKLEQEAADKARRAAASLSQSAPGAPAQPGKPGKKTSKSVRESIEEARKQILDRA